MVTIAKGEIPVGLDLGSHEYEITPELVAEYAAGVNDRHSWYTGDSPFGGAIAPALILAPAVWLFVVKQPEDRGLLPDGAPAGAPVPQPSETDVWTIGRAIRDASSVESGA